MNNQIEKISPSGIFTNYIFKTIPLAFDESMSYYETLCGILSLLKTQEEVVNNNADVLAELENYVTHYFDNLDVQEEINNKLDQMAEDGSLTLLIKNYVDPIYEQYQENINNELNIYKNTLNNEMYEYKMSMNEDFEDFKNDVNIDIQDINNKVENMINGSPLVADSIDNMTETDRVYINSTNGHWYWYDGTSWNDGGVYQATQLSDNEIKLNMLETILKNFYNLNDDTTLLSNLVWEEGYYYRSNSTTITKTAYANTNCTSINVQEGEVYNIYGYSSGQAGMFVVGDEDDNNLLSPTTTSGYSFQTIIIPTNATKLYINKWINNDIIIVSKANSFNISETNSQKIQNQFLELINKYDGIQLKNFSQRISSTKYTRWIYVSTQDDIYDTDIIELNAYVYSSDLSKINEIDIGDSQDGSSPYNRRIFNLDAINYECKKVFQKINDNFYKIKLRFTSSSYTGTNRQLLIGLVTEQSLSDYECIMYNISLNNITQDSTIDIYDKITSYSNDEIKIIFNYLSNQLDIEDYIPKLGFTKWYAIGDSITAKNEHASKNYVDYVTEDLKYISSVNLGVSGTGYNAGKDNHRCYIDRLAQITNYNIETDIITVYGSTNDYGRPLGQKGDTTDDTVYGSLYLFFETLYSTFTGARIGLITPLPIQNNYHSTTEINYRNALIEMANEYNVPVLDITRKCNLEPNNADFRDEFYSHDGEGGSGTDGTHPNSKGHRIIANQIKEFLKTL